MLAFWSSREFDLGIAHCNLAPNSLLFDDAGKSGPPAVSTILGWSYLSRSGPAGFDSCHLALTTRMAVRDQELGPIVHDFLNGGTWTDAERRWLSHESTTGEWLRHDDLMREMVLLTWLNHLAHRFDDDPAHTISRAWLAVNVFWPLRQAERYVVTK